MQKTPRGGKHSPSSLGSPTSLHRRRFLGAMALLGAGCAAPARSRRGRPRPSYDVIIVGGGTAGCILAARLSEDPRRSVLVIEAGPDFGDEAHLPDEVRDYRRISLSYDWSYTTDAAGYPPRAVGLPRGRLMGGSSAVNAVTALRGHAADYDEWRALGNEGWGYEDLLPAFCRLERDEDFRDRWHGQAGPVPIARVPLARQTAQQQAFVAACRQAGHAEVADHNAPRAIGIGAMPRNVRDGVRESTFLTHLAPARTRRNLTIRAETLVDRVIFDGHRAMGVRLAGPTGELITAGHVILSAGSYGSPSLLLRSGVGPAAHLRSLGIPVVADRPGVGANLVDHPRCVMEYAGTAAAPTVFAPTTNVLTMRSTQATGAMPDLQTMMHERNGGLAFLVSVMKPASVGSLRLSSIDPAAMPSIDHNYLKQQADLSRLAELVLANRKLVASSELSRWFGAERWPGPQYSDAPSIEAMLATGVRTYFHAVGTCTMGPARQKAAVVDQRARVHATEGLSVIDASIMPTVPSANTNVAVMMVAEHAARLTL